jgi:hypothetical protein
MATLESRLEKLEAALQVSDLANMTDAELDAYAGTLPFQSGAQVAAIITLLGRHPSAFPVATNIVG